MLLGYFFRQLSSRIKQNRNTDRFSSHQNMRVALTMARLTKALKPMMSPATDIETDIFPTVRAHFGELEAWHCAITTHTHDAHG